MFDSQCDLAALVYQHHEDPDAVLREFVADIGQRGFRAVGLLQLGHRVESAPLSAVLIHTGVTVHLFQDRGPGAAGCKLDVGELLGAAEQVASGMDEGADVVIINRYGRQERAGGGLSHLIARALDADIPVVIAVPQYRFAEWISFSGGMSVKLACDRRALNAWWETVSVTTGSSLAHADTQHRQISFCEALK